MGASVLVVFRIAVSFALLFILPFILVSFKIFHDKDKLFQAYVSMVIGLFTSIGLVYLLAIFGAFNKINFLVSYGLIIVVFNLYFLRKIRQPKISFKLRLTPPLLLLLFAFGIGSYMRLYDPMKHISLGTIDFYRHLTFLQEALAGHIFTSYPKVYHAILALMYFVSSVDSYAMVRFGGAFFGILSIGAVYCFMKQVFGQKSAIFAVLFYSGFTILNLLTVEQTGSFPQGFGFVLIPLLVYFALELMNNFKENKVVKRNILVFIFVVFLLSLISPYVTLQMSYLLYFLLFFAIAFHPDIRKHTRRFLGRTVALIVLFSLGMIIVFSYYVILLEFRGEGIYLPIYDESRIAGLIEEGETRWDAMGEGIMLGDWTNNKWAITKALLRMKKLQVPVEFPLSIGVYVMLLLGLLVIVRSIRRRSPKFFAISVFILLYGISSITGILEFPKYSGRSGWYFMLGSIWLGAIMLKRFYNQELMRDIFHILRRVTPLRIVDRVKSIKESRISLIHAVLTLSILASYLAVVYAFGLYRSNLIRDLLFLLLIPTMVYVASKKRRDILSGELEPYSLHKNTRSYGSLHKSLVLAVVFVVMLYPLPRPPEYNFRYYHRGLNEDDFVKVLQEVKDEYPLSEVKMFFDSDIVYRAWEKTIRLVYPQSIKTARIDDVLSYSQKETSETALKRYNFLFLDRKKEKSGSLNGIMEWIFTYKEEHNKVRLFYDSQRIAVYLLENA